jgi:hypothetical protein
LSASPPRLEFGNVVATTTSKPKKLTLRNKGRSPATIGELIAPISFKISTDTCSNRSSTSPGAKPVLNPGETCFLDLEFAPATPVGKVKETFYSTNGEKMADTEFFEGNGIAVILRAPRVENFPRVAPNSASRPKNIKIRNLTDAAVQFGPASAPTDFAITADGCANTMLASKASCVVTVEFAPQTGDNPGSISNTLNYNFTYGANGGSVAVVLRGKVS